MSNKKKVNDIVIKPIPVRKEDRDDRPIAGADMFSEIYANIFLCARKASGKTTVVANIIDQCATRESTVIVFASTFYNDPIYKHIRETCGKKGIPIIGYTSTIEGKVNYLDVLEKHLENLAKGREIAQTGTRVETLDLSSTVEVKVRRPKLRGPEFLIILDDLSNETRSQAVTAMFKKNRHYHIKLVASSQSLKDLAPSALRQLDYMLIFKSMDTVTLETVHDTCQVKIPFEQFEELYYDSTSEGRNFFYIDFVNQLFRKNFNEEYILG